MGALSRIFVSCTILTAASYGAAAPNAEPGLLPTRSDEQPCAAVSQAYASQSAANPSATIWSVPAKLARDCLESVPIKKPDALKVVDGLASFWKWQSTIDFLKNPPKGYQVPGVDLSAGLAEIRSKVDGEKYKGEIDFQEDLTKLVTSAHDGHFTLMLDAGSVFTFSRSDIGEIVSVSQDGKSHPEIFVYRDLEAADKVSYKPSPIAQIDGRDVVDWLKEKSYTSTKQDPDAQWNDLFYSIPNDVETYGYFYSQPLAYTGPSTTLQFKNGTKKEYQNEATFSTPFGGVHDGESFYSQFCNGELATSPTTGMVKKDVLTAAPISRRQSNSKRSKFPKAVKQLDSGEIAGYFLDGEHSDTAVLSISSFVNSMSPSTTQGFQNVISDFLKACRENQKKKLIIDVTSNGGGTIFLGYDAFKQLFPKTAPTDSFNIRAQEQIDLIGSKVQALLNDGKTTAADISLEDSFLDLSAYVNLENKKFKSWEDYYGPVTVQDNFNFSRLARWDFNNKEVSETTGGGIHVSGYLDRTNLPPQAFKPEDMVLLTDGTCASTCTIFANLLKMNGVKSVATGGRPQDGPMQAVGGAKGSQVLGFSLIYKVASTVYSKYSTPEEQKRWEATDLGQINRVGQYILGRSLSGGESSRINYRNSIRVDDESKTPLQFVYEAADCRIWQTPKAVFDMTALWTNAADAAWGKGECIPGSTAPQT